MGFTTNNAFDYAEYQKNYQSNWWNIPFHVIEYVIFISSFLLSIHSCLMAHGLLLPHSHYQVIPSSFCEFLLIYIHISLLLPLLFFILPSFLSCFLAFLLSFSLPPIILILHFLRHYFFLFFRYSVLLVFHSPIHFLIWLILIAVTYAVRTPLGMGWGLQIGAELTEVLLILSSDSAVDAFKSRAQVLTIIPYWYLHFYLYLYSYFCLHSYLCHIV